jgi:hypothetical protein
MAPGIAVDGNPSDSACQAPWIVSVMWSAGALVDKVGPCAAHAEARIVMRLSELGYSAVFDVQVCRDHRETLRRSPYHVSSDVLPREDA